MIRLREMPIAVNFIRIGGEPVQKKSFMYNFGIGHTSFILKCNIQHRGIARVKVEYGDVLLGEFGWHSGIAYIVGEVTTANPSIYPAHLVTVTTEASISNLEYMLSVDFWLVCDEPTPAPHPYNVARGSGTAIPDDNTSTTTFPPTPSNLTTQAPTTTWTRTTANPSLTTTTMTTPVPVTIIPTYTPTTTAPAEPTPTTTFPVTTSLAPTTFEPTTTQQPPSTYPIDPTTEPLDVSRIAGVKDDILNNFAYPESDQALVARYKIRGGHGLYQTDYTGLEPPLVVRAFSNEINAINKVNPRTDTSLYSTDTIRDVLIAYPSNNAFAKNQAGIKNISIHVNDSTNDDTSMDAYTVHDSSETIVDPPSNDVHDLIISAYRTTDFLTDDSLSGADHFMENKSILEYLKFSWFPTATWYMAFQNIRYNSMLIKINADAEPMSIKNWYFYFSPATVLKNKASMSPYSLRPDDPVYLDTTASKWFSLDKCLVIPRFKLVDKYYYWLFVFPDMATYINYNYDTEPDQNSILWTRLNKEYLFYNGGPFTFTRHSMAVTGVDKPAPIFYAGTFRADIKTDDGSEVLKTTGNVDFWYSCGDTLAVPQYARSNSLKLNLVEP